MKTEWKEIDYHLWCGLDELNKGKTIWLKFEDEITDEKFLNELKEHYPEYEITRNNDVFDFKLKIMKRPKPFYSDDKTSRELIKQVLEYSHWKDIVKLTEQFLDAVDEAYKNDEDYEPDTDYWEISEAVMKAIYGENIWNYINSKLL